LTGRCSRLVRDEGWESEVLLDRTGQEYPGIWTERISQFSAVEW
jgi:hypothetical protein